MLNPEAPRILIATGKICAGKTTLMGRLVTEDGFRVLDAAYITRSPREGDFPGEYNYVTDEEFDALDPTDKMWTTQHGSPSRYTLLRSVVRSAIEDTEGLYTRPLAPHSAFKVINEFGQDVVRVIYLPTPNRDELITRALQRGDDLCKLTARLESEAGWDEFARQTPELHIAQGHTAEELHTEALGLMMLSAS